MKTIDELGISQTPWHVGKTETHRIYHSGDCAIATGHNFCLNGEIEEANARLIAAAPDCYEALRKMQECFDYIRSTAWFMDANFASIQKMTVAQNEAKKALAKASGEEVE